jgi:hypothetical protein
MLRQSAAHGRQARESSVPSSILNEYDPAKPNDFDAWKRERVLPQCSILQHASATSDVTSVLTTLPSRGACLAGSAGARA